MKAEAVALWPRCRKSGPLRKAGGRIVGLMAVRRDRRNRVVASYFALIGLMGSVLIPLQQW